MSIPQLLVHDRRDNVGVVVVEGLTAGTDMLCVVTEDNSDFRLVAQADIPISSPPSSIPRSRERCCGIPRLRSRG